jgi:hypothetical protein
VLRYNCSKDASYEKEDIYGEESMSTPIRISEDIYSAAKKVAKAEFRSVPHQIEFWAKIGKCALDNPDLPIEFIKEILIAKNQDRSLAEPFIFEIKATKSD